MGKTSIKINEMKMRRSFIEQFPNHPCELKREERFTGRPGKREEIRFKIKKILLISDKNIRSHIYLRSRGAIELEKLRQIRSRHWYVVHPFSELRHCWESFQSVVLLLSLFLLPFQSSFLNPFVAKYRIEKGLPTEDFSPVAFSAAVLDAFWVADVLGNFFTGYPVPGTKQVVTNPWRIVQKYFFGRFSADLFVAFPVDFVLIHASGIRYYSGLSHEAFVFLQVYDLSKLWRFGTFVSYFDRVSERLSSSRIVNRLALVVLIYALINHWGACLCFSMPQMAYGEKLYRGDGEPYESSWIRKKNILSKTVFEQYVFAVFHALTNVVGVGSTLKGSFDGVDQLVAAAVSVAGRCYWIWFLVMFFRVVATAYASRTKFFEIFDRIKEYVRHRRLSRESEKRLVQFYRYRFQTHYFREKAILGSMSENLAREIALHTCHKLIENTEIFRRLPKKAIETIVRSLKCEVYLPDDTVVRAGDPGDSMYFVRSGTARAYTPSGKELCDFKDGDYFGELALILEDEKRTATIVATEVTELYKFDGRHFWQIVVSYPEVFATVEKKALERYEATLRMDDRYLDFDSEIKVKKKNWKSQTSE